MLMKKIPNLNSPENNQKVCPNLGKNNYFIIRNCYFIIIIGFRFTEKRLLKKAENKDDEVYSFTLKYPDYYPGMEYIKDSELRKKIQHSYNSRCIE